ncbi:RAB3A interacting protein [Mortierella sp. AD032]|nr:RAB3A interacting protein [Mortierella sp. AD032]
MEQPNTDPSDAQAHPQPNTDGEPTDAETNATATTASTTTEVASHLNNGDTAHQEDSRCPCYKVLADSKSRACGICERIIPSLDDAHKEHTRLVEEMEQAQARLAEEKKRALAATVDVEVLRKKIEDLEDSLQAKTDDYDSVQKDLSILNDKYVDEIEKVAELQHAKETVEGELEELSRTLFEEANGMVATEARARHQLELTRKHLELELKDAHERLAAETSQLKELKSKMEAMMESQPQSKRSSTNHSDRGSVDLAQLFGINNNKISVPESLAEEPEPETAIAIDGQLLQEFREFVTQSSSIRLNKIHTLTFMRHCQDEDVEPCLRFGNTPRISAKKLTEGICSNTCYIEEATADQVKEYERMVLAAQQPPSPARNSMSNKSVLWERLQNQYAMYQAPKGGCQTCGRSGPLSHRYRIASLDEWSFIDRFCRDRLVAVCEFYIFIRNIRAGLYATRSIEDLYSESLRLRLQMFYARSGVLPIMLSELGTTAQSIGNMGSAGQGQWPEGTPPLRGEGSDAGSINSASASAFTTPINTPKIERAELLSRSVSREEVVSAKTSLDDKAQSPVSPTAAEGTDTETATSTTTAPLASAGPEPTSS